MTGAQTVVPATNMAELRPPRKSSGPVDPSLKENWDAAVVPWVTSWENERLC